MYYSLTYVDFFGAAAEGRVVLLHEVPADLVLGNVGSRVVRLGRRRGRVAGGGVARLIYRAITILRDEGAVHSGFRSHCEETKKRTDASNSAARKIGTMSDDATVSALGFSIQSLQIEAAAGCATGVSVYGRVSPLK